MMVAATRGETLPGLCRGAPFAPERLWQ
jgi:hypothetical protein